MIAGHVCTKGWKRTFIFSFHMPLFIIVNGMFFNDKENFKNITIKLIKKLIIPYVLAIITGQVLNVLIYNGQCDIWSTVKQIILAYSNRKTFFQDTYTVSVLWFIPFLACSKMMFYLINKISKNDDILKGVICIILTITGIYLAKINIFLPWSFDVVLSSTIFYYIGYVLKKYNLLEKILENSKIMISIIILYYLGLKFGHIELAIRLYPYALISYVTAISGTLIIFKISKIIEQIFKYLSRVIAWFGENSMYILCFHYLEMKLVKYSIMGISGKYQLFAAKLIIVTMLTFILLNIFKIFNKINIINIFSTKFLLKEGRQ